MICIEQQHSSKVQFGHSSLDLLLLQSSGEHPQIAHLSSILVPLQLIFFFQFFVQPFTAYPRKIRNAYNFDLAINNCGRNCFDFITSHLSFDLISHVVDIVNYLVTAFTFAYLNFFSYVLAERAVCREYLNRMMLPQCFFFSFILHYFPSAGFACICYKSIPRQPWFQQGNHTCNCIYAVIVPFWFFNPAMLSIYLIL